MKKILLIEADADLYALLRDNLEKEGFTLFGSRTGKGALELCRQGHPDLLLMDIMLPDCDGLEICREVRKDHDLADIPIIILTARSSETDRIVGLELGASDYIVKPFSIRELIARIRLQFRRAGAAARVLEVGALRLDKGRCEARLAGKLLDLTATEFRLLEFLMTKPGIVFRREQLLNAVWGEGRAITDRSVDVYVMRLRQKIESDPTRPVLIHAVRGFGYTLEHRPYFDDPDDPKKGEPEAELPATTPRN